MKKLLMREREKSYMEITIGQQQINHQERTEPRTLQVETTDIREKQLTSNPTFSLMSRTKPPDKETPITISLIPKNGLKVALLLLDGQPQQGFKNQ